MGRRSFLLLLVFVSGCVTTTTTVTRPEKRDVTELVQLAGDAIIVKEHISFPHGKADIDEGSLDLLDRVAEILKTTQAITKLTIEGHTDTTGDPDFNLPLSEARALAVKKYLESKGVAPDRLEARGFGAEQPMDSNDTDAGRAKNRRVEFKVTR
ncbi:MAG: OmpA family protein [Archangium sp.]|nr:OmpA family protein [Archangium sp.]